MRRFRYEALSRGGQRLSGELEATTRAAALERLIGQGLIPVSAEATDLALGSKSRSLWVWPARRIPAAELIVATRQLATLLRAGQPLDRALRVLSEHTDHRRLRHALHDVLTAVRNGSSLGAALAAEPSIFSPLYVNMVHAGERSGALEIVLGRLADFLGRADAVRKRIAAATLYPIILLFATMSSVALMLTVVVPQFKPLFKDAGTTLPLATQIVMGASDTIQAHGRSAALAFLLLLLVGQRAARRPAVRIWMDAYALRAPLLGPLIRKSETSKFCRTLATLQRNGVPLPTALTLAAGVFGNRWMAAALENVATLLRQGGGLTAPLKTAGVFPDLALQLIRSGEESGQLAEMLELVADIHDEQVQHAIERLFTLLTPILTVFLAVMIGGVVASIILPLLSLNSLIK